MTYRERQRLADIQAAIDAIRSHLQRGDLSDGLIFDAVRIRLLEIGEAVKALPEDLLFTQPSIPWRQITRMRDLYCSRTPRGGCDPRFGLLTVMRQDRGLCRFDFCTSPSSRSLAGCTC